MWIPVWLFPPRCRDEAHLDVVPSTNRAPLCRALNQNMSLYSVCGAGQPQSLKEHSSYLYLFAVPVLFSATLNQNWTNMVRCQVPPDVFFHLSIIRYGAIHQSSFFLRSARSIGDFFFTLFHTLRRRGWQMRIMCNIARRIGYTWLIKTAAHGARRCDRNNNHTSLRLGNSQSYCFPWGTPPRLLLARC